MERECPRARRGVWSTLERLYGRLGKRYLEAFVFLAWLLAILFGFGFVVGVVIPYPDGGVSPGEAAIGLAVIEGGMTLGAVVADWVWLRQARPFREWLQAGRQPERAPEIWRLVVRLPLRFALLAFPAGVVFVAVPMTLYARLTLDVSAAETVFSFVAVVSGGVYLTLLVYLLLELYLGPVRRDLAARMAAGFRLDQPRLAMARRLLTVQVLIAAGGGAAVAWGLSLPDGSEERAAAGLGLAAIATLTVTLGLATLFNRSFAEPVRDLLEATRRVKAGQLPAAVPVLSDDELGVLAGSFSEMTADLQRAREQRVAAREEERRRLRRDLHDGLGAALAAHSMRTEAAAGLVGDDPKTAEALLDQLRADLGETIADVRRLVRGLRPPQLDELGLIGAIEGSAEQLMIFGSDPAPGGLRLRIEAPPELPPLPAAVEVAAYRIAQEAITNVVRHSHARQCVVRVALNSALELEVSDDGSGLAGPGSAGVGLSSMRERAAELGGTCAVRSRAGGGTVVSVQLPLSPPGA